MDRNLNFATCCTVVLRSLSARRAWIEMIQYRLELSAHGKVALRKESVDRNKARKAGCNKATVALRKESVDRNSYC